MPPAFISTSEDPLISKHEDELDQLTSKLAHLTRSKTSIVRNLALGRIGKANDNLQDFQQKLIADLVSLYSTGSYDTQNLNGCWTKLQEFWVEQHRRYPVSEDCRLYNNTNPHNTRDTYEDPEQTLQNLMNGTDQLQFKYDTLFNFENRDEQARAQSILDSFEALSEHCLRSLRLHRHFEPARPALHPATAAFIIHQMHKVPHTMAAGSNAVTLGDLIWDLADKALSEYGAYIPDSCEWLNTTVDNMLILF